MRSDVIVEVWVVGESGASGGDGELAAVEVPELEAGAVVGAFDATIEPGASGWQDKLGDIEWLAGWLELAPEPATAVDLDGGEGQVLNHGLQEASGEISLLRRGCTPEWSAGVGP